jgi:D-alanine-D-alanine ligase
LLEAILKRIPKELSQTNIGLISGGPSQERDFSIRSGQRVQRALLKLGLKVFSFEYSDQLQHQLQQENIQLCYLATHGVPGEDGKLQGFLESIGCYYSGPSVAGSALSMNKMASKSLLQSEGVLTPKWMRIDPHCPSEETVRTLSQRLGYPLIIKPIFGGSSIGVRLVNDRSECRTALDALSSEHHHLFAETYIEGRECVVSYLEDSSSRPYSLPIMEVESKNLFYDYDSKLNGGKKDFVVPLELPKAQEQKLLSWGKMAHEQLMLRDASRSDFILAKNGDIYYLETNSIPGMTENSDLPAQAKAAGLLFEELVLSILMGPWRRLRHSKHREG